MRPTSSARFVAPSGEWLRFCREDEVAYILDRTALNRALADRAGEAGAIYLLGTRTTGIEVERDSVRVEADCAGETRVFEAKTAVIATGFGSPLPFRLGLGKISDIVLGAQVEVETSGVDEIEVYFDQALAPNGFAWLVPTAGRRGLAGLFTTRNPKACLRRLLSGLQGKQKITTMLGGPGYAAIPVSPLGRTYTDRVLVMGEVAGQVKPTTGGGIYYGLLCADIAAECLNQAFAAGDFSAARLSVYERKWRARLGHELQVGRWLVKLYRHLGNQHIERLLHLASRNQIPEFVAGLETLPFDWHGRLLAKLLGHVATQAPRQTLRAISQKLSLMRQQP